MNTLQKHHEMKETKTQNPKPKHRKFKTAEKKRALELYKTEQYSIKEIALIVKVRQNTVSDWVKKYKATRLNFKNEITKLIKALNIELDKPNINSKAVYCISNTMKTLKNLQE